MPNACTIFRDGRGRWTPQISVNIRYPALPLMHESAIHFNFGEGVVGRIVGRPDLRVRENAQVGMFENLNQDSVIANYNAARELVSVIIFTSKKRPASAWLAANPHAFDYMRWYMAWHHDELVAPDLAMLARVALAT